MSKLERAKRKLLKLETEKNSIGSRIDSLREKLESKSHTERPKDKIEKFIATGQSQINDIDRKIVQVKKNISELEKIEAPEQSLSEMLRTPVTKATGKDQVVPSNEGDVVEVPDIIQTTQAAPVASSSDDVAGQAAPISTFPNATVPENTATTTAIVSTVTATRPISLGPFDFPLITNQQQSNLAPDAIIEDIIDEDEILGAQARASNYGANYIPLYTNSGNRIKPRYPVWPPKLNPDIVPNFGIPLETPKKPADNIHRGQNVIRQVTFNSEKPSGKNTKITDSVELRHSQLATQNKRLNAFNTYRNKPAEIPETSEDEEVLLPSQNWQSRKNMVPPHRGIPTNNRETQATIERDNLNVTFDIPNHNTNPAWYERIQQPAVIQNPIIRADRNEDFPNQNPIIRANFPVQNPIIRANRNEDFPMQNPIMHNNFDHEPAVIPHMHDNHNNRQGTLQNINPNRLHFSDIANQVAYNPNGPRNIFLKRLNNIPDFDGESFESFKKFMEKSETLYYSCANEAENSELFEQILLKVNRETRNLIVSLNNLDWETIKTALMKHYAHLCNKNLVTTQLENVKQKKDESLLDYAERARKLLRNKQAMYMNLSEEQRTEYNRTASKAFVKGITNSGLKERVMTRGAETLEGAIENALDMETDAMEQVARNELYCRSCNMPGHRERDCRRKNGNNNIISKLADALKTMGNSNNSRQNENLFQRDRNFRPTWSFRPNNFRTNQFFSRNNSRFNTYRGPNNYNSGYFTGYGNNNSRNFNNNYPQTGAFNGIRRYDNGNTNFRFEQRNRESGTLREGRDANNQVNNSFRGNLNAGNQSNQLNSFRANVRTNQQIKHQEN